MEAMKKILTLLLFLPLFSCNKWLDVEPETSITFGNYFKNESEVEAFYNSIGCNMKHICIGKEPYFYISIDADYLTYDLKGYATLDPDTYLPEESQTLCDSWANYYNVIYLANVMIENEYRYENISKERTNFWLAQAHFAKAMTYFRIAQIWGDAPIVKNSESIDPVGKSPALDVLEEAAKEAKLALNLPTYDQLTDSKGNQITSKQYASLGTVKTLLANIYAWMGGLTGNAEYWTLAESYASEVIDGKAGAYQLESIEDLVPNVFGKVRKSDEVIFCIDNDPLDYDNRYLDSYDAKQPGQMLLSFPYTTTDSSAIAALAIDYFDEYNKISVATVKKIFREEKDARRREYWHELGKLKYKSTSGQYVTTRYAHIAKWRDVVIQENTEIVQTRPVIGSDCDWVVWRLADLILLRAECRARLNRADAIDDLNKIRNRAELPNYDNSQAHDLRREIFEERRRELFGEGHFYFDVIRNGYYREYLQGEFKKLTQQDVLNGALYTPVNASAFTKNTLMTQNTYWQWKK